MPTVQMNKRFGLKKLKKIAGKDPRWSVSPHINLKSLQQFRTEKAKRMPRLLIRTDEAGKIYKHFNWEQIPRFELSTKKFSEKEVKEHLLRLGYRPSSLERLRYIFHPTRPREDIHTFGVAVIRNYLGSNMTLEIKLGNSQPNNPYHRKQTEKSIIFVRKEKKWILKSQIPGIKKYSRLLRIVRSFVEKGLTQNQIKPREYQEMSFLTWKDDPAKPEFFDYIEERIRPNKKLANDIKF
jgi:hypothetical protein